MAWSITPADDGTWDWSCFQSAYGAASGNAPTVPAAKVELAIAEAAILERPYPPAVTAAMRAEPERYAVYFPDPALMVNERRIHAHTGLIFDATGAVTEAMRQRGWTCEQLARALGVRPSKVAKRLRGDMTLDQLADMLHVMGYDVQVAKVRRDETGGRGRG